MIKAEDLRIGDLVRVSRDCAFPKGTVCIITDIHAEKTFMDKKGVVDISSVNDTDDGPWGTWCCNIEGMPITPEILEKNGWENTEYTPLIYIHDEHCIEFWTSLKGFDDGGTVTYHDEELLDVKYVHELQHILWALGLKAEFKI